MAAAVADAVSAVARAHSMHCFTRSLSAAVLVSWNAARFYLSMQKALSSVQRWSIGGMRDVVVSSVVLLTFERLGLQSCSCINKHTLRGTAVREKSGYVQYRVQAGR